MENLKKPIIQKIFKKSLSFFIAFLIFFYPSYNSFITFAQNINFQIARTNWPSWIIEGDEQNLQTDTNVNLLIPDTPTVDPNAPVPQNTDNAGGVNGVTGGIGNNANGIGGNAGTVGNGDANTNTLNWINNTQWTTTETLLQTNPDATTTNTVTPIWGDNGLWAGQPVTNTLSTTPWDNTPWAQGTCSAPYYTSRSNANAFVYSQCNWLNQVEAIDIRIITTDDHNCYELLNYRCKEVPVQETQDPDIYDTEVRSTVQPTVVNDLTGEQHSEVSDSEDCPEGWITEAWQLSPAAQEWEEEWGIGTSPTLAPKCDEYYAPMIGQVVGATLGHLNTPTPTATQITNNQARITEIGKKIAELWASDVDKILELHAEKTIIETENTRLLQQQAIQNNDTTAINEKISQLQQQRAEQLAAIKAKWDQAIDADYAKLKKINDEIDAQEETSRGGKSEFASTLSEMHDSVDHGEAAMAWVWHWFSYAMACNDQPWCNIAQVGLVTGLAWYAWSYMWQAASSKIDSNTFWEGGISGTVWAAAFAWVAAYMMCSSRDEDDPEWKKMSPQQQEKIQSQCKTQAMVSAWSSVATSYLQHTYVDTVEWWIPSSVADSSSFITSKAIAWWAIAWWVTALAVLLQWWDLKTAAKAWAQAAVVSIVSSSIVSYLGTTSAFAFLIPWWPVAFIAWILISWLISQFICPFYYIVLPNWSVAFQWAFLVWKVSKSDQWFSYEVISPRAVADGVVNWILNLRITEELNEDLYLDSVSLLKVSHKQNKDVILNKTWNAHVIENPRTLSLVYPETQTWTWKSNNIISPIAIALPKIKKETELIFLWWIDSNKVFQTTTTEVKTKISKVIPDWAIDPIYLLIDAFKPLWKLLFKKTMSFEWITLESCEVQEIWECKWEIVDQMITYPQQKRVFGLWKELIWKDLRLRFNKNVVVMNNIWYDDRIEENEKEVIITEIKANNEPSELNQVDSNYKIFKLWDKLDLYFDIPSAKEGMLDTYYMKTNGYYHPKGI